MGEALAKLKLSAKKIKQEISILIEAYKRRYRFMQRY
jgi:hypothetical protein